MTSHVIKLSDLSAEGVRALRKCEAAERCTTVPGRVRGEVYITFQEDGLIEWRNGYRLTELGRGLLARAARTAPGKARRGGR